MNRIFPQDPRVDGYLRDLGIANPSKAERKNVAVAVNILHARRLALDRPQLVDQLRKIPMSEPNGAYMHFLGISQKPEQVKKRLGLTVKFMESRFPQWNAGDVLSHMRGIDFSKEIRFRILREKEDLLRYHSPFVQGQRKLRKLKDAFWYSKSGPAKENLGIPTVGRHAGHHRVRKKVIVMECFAAPMRITEDAKKRMHFGGIHKQVANPQVHLEAGGGKQFLVPKPSRHLKLMVPTRRP